MERTEWGQAIVKELAIHIQKTEPELRGYSDKNLWRMKQFYETYHDEPKLSALLREIHPDIKGTFKDSYVLDFLNLKEPYNENDLQKALVGQMREFLVELGKDFLFMDQEFRVQVGNSDFFIDLLLFHRGLQCLVAIELKADKFRPDYLGQINFYLEALDRDIKKPHENPSIGILLCKDRDEEVVEYALSRSLSPTLVSEYKMQLPDKRMLQQKLHEIFNEMPESNG